MCLWSHLKHVFGTFKFSPRIEPTDPNPKAKFPIVRMKVERVKGTKSNSDIVVNKRNRRWNYPSRSLCIERFEKRQNVAKIAHF